MNWFFSLFLKFSGDDYLLLDKCHLITRIRFAIIGSLIFSFFLISTFSLGFALSQIFQSLIIGIILGGFIALVFTNIYLLLLYTYNERVLPAKKPTIIATSLSHAVRLFSLIFMIFIIGLPTELFVHQEYLNKKIEIYKKNKIKKYENKTMIVYKQMISELILRRNKMVNVNQGIQPEQEIFYNTLINKKKEELKIKKEIMAQRINHSDFFIRKILFYSEASFFPYFILLYLVIFHLPLLLKTANKLFKINDYVKLKTSVYKGLVDKSYVLFKDAYLNHLQAYAKDENISKGIVLPWTEKYLDPPFNTRPKPEPAPDSEQALKNWLNHAAAT